MGAKRMVETVLVVGAGPVGQTMALELARYGVPVRLVDKMAERSDKSRAVGVWPRTLELLDRAGSISGELIALGNKVEAANILAGQTQIARITLKGVETPYPFALMLPQYDTESALEKHLEGHGVRSELGVELTSFEQQANGVTAVLTHPDGKVENTRFGWLVACDGSHSAIRHELNLAFPGDTIGTDWCLGDFHMTGLAFPLTDLVTYWHEDGPLVMFPMAPGRYRLIASLGPSTGTPPAAPTIEAFQALLDRRGPGGVTLTDAIWISAFRINERQIANYRNGRVFLAGDAAHVHSPAGAQGMNTGMQDAFNLAWKLALVCRGLASAPALLDSYQPERHAVGAEVIESSGRLTKVALIANPVARFLRDTIGHFILGLQPVQHAVAETMTELSTGYPESPLNGPSAHSATGAGKRMRPLAGETPYGAGDTPRFTLRAGPAAGASPAFSHRLADSVIRPDPAPGIQLVRPDGYLAMSAADDDWAAVTRYLDSL